MPLPPSLLIDSDEYGEVIVTLDHYWTVGDWQEAENSGIIPLRQISPYEMLAWARLDSGYDVPEEIVELRGGTGYENYRVVLEPYLPNDAVDDVYSKFENIGLNTEWIRVSNPQIALTSIFEIEVRGGLEEFLPVLKQVDGIYWIEPIMQTTGRNDVAAALMQSGSMENHPAWLLGIDGSGVIVASGDSGIDRDHACFREAVNGTSSGSERGNATGTPSEHHRKLVFLNETIDDWDSQGDENYLHGTHVAGSLVCRLVYEDAAEDVGDWQNATPSEGTAIAHGAKLVFEDLVGDTGWIVPEVGELFWESATHGAIIRSDSWGDDTTAYTSRTSDFDTWLLQVPWSVSFVAPGNTAGEVLEPANGLNVVSVGVGAKDGTNDVWSLSPRESTEQGRQGVSLVIPGQSIFSAAADDDHTSYNGDFRYSTGSSMATPQAAGMAALIQQLVENGWVSGTEERGTVSTHQLRPNWVGEIDENLSDGEILLADGFTPSGSLMRALMTLSADEMEDGRQNEHVLGIGPDDRQGWGRANLSNLIDFQEVELLLADESVDPSPDLWVHDSYRITNSWQELVSEWVSGANPMEAVVNSQWRGDGAAGPFIASGEYVSWEMPLVAGSDFTARLAWSSNPNPESSDNLDLIVKVGEEWFFGNDFDGWNSVSHTSNSSENGNSSIDTVEGIRLSSELLQDADSVTVFVRAEFVSIGPSQGVVGMGGDRIGFALAVSGVVRDSVEVVNGWAIVEEVRTDSTFDDSLDLWVLYSLPIIIIAVAIITVREAQKNRNLFGDENIVDLCQPSNSEGVSLASADAPQIGEEE